MKPNRFMPVFAIATLAVGLLGGLTWVAEPAQAQPSAWSTVAIPTEGHTPGHVNAPASELAAGLEVASNGEAVMVAFTYTSPSANIQVSFKADEDALWESRNSAAFSGVGLAAFYGLQLQHVTGDTWLIGLVAGAGADIWQTLKSTDNGATWTSQSAFDQGSGSIVSPSMSVAPGTNIVILANERTSNNVHFFKSTDLGVTWSAQNNLHDNQGGTTAPTASISSIGQISAQATDANTYNVIFTSGAYGIFSVGTLDGGFFWSVPYTSNGGSTMAPIEDCSGTTVAQPDTSGRSAVSKGPGGGFLFAVVDASLTPDSPCAFLGSESENVAPTNAITTAGTSWIDDRADGQRLMAFGDLTANTNYVYYGAPGTAWSLVHTNSADTSQTAVTLTPTKGYHIYVANDFGGQIRVDEATDFPVLGGGAVTPVATVSVTGLNGFDVSPGGETAIARVDSGDTVKVYDGSLSGTPATKDTDCGARSGRVATMGNHVAYFDCDPGGEVVQVEIRSKTLGTPTKPSLCSDAGFCLEDIPTECGTDPGVSCVAGDQDDDTLFGILEALPIDYSNYDRGTLNDDAVYVGMAFADEAGRIGVWTYSMNNNADDESRIVAEGISTQTPDALCAHRDPDGSTFIYGSSTSSNVQGFRVGSSYSGGSGGAADDTVTPTLTRVFSGTAATAGARGVACGDVRLIILQDDRVTIWNRALQTGQSVSPSITITGIGDAWLNGAAMSDDGNWAVFATEDGYASVLSTTDLNGTVRCRLDLPDGSLRAIQMHGHGTTVWAATTTAIAWYDTVACTTGTDVVFNDVEDPEDIDGDGTLNEDDPDIDGDGIPNTTDTDDDGDGILDTVDPSPGGAGVGPAAGEGGRSFLGNSEEDVEAAIDGVSGVGSVLTDIVLGLIPLWIILIAVLVGVAVLVMRLRSG